MRLRQGTTPTITCNVNIDMRDAVKITLTIKDDSNNIVKLRKESLSISDTKVVGILTQEQTLSLNDRVKVQIKAKIGDSVFESNIVYGPIAEVLDTEVM